MPPPVPLLEPAPPATSKKVKRDREWNLSPASPAGTFAVVSCIKSLPVFTSLDDAAMVQVLLPTLNRTITFEERAAWNVRIYLCADDNDYFFLNRTAEVAAVGRRFGFDVRMRFYPTVRNRIPSREAARDAVAEGADYLHRTNDDISYIDRGWMSGAVRALRALDPPNVGVVGPKSWGDGIRSRGGMTVDTVHRTHLQLFQHYYPAQLDNWYVDDWITYAYTDKFSRAVMLHASPWFPHVEFSVQHKFTKRRYKVDKTQAALAAPLVECARNVVAGYIASLRTGAAPQPPVSCVAYRKDVPAQPPDGAGGRCVHRVRPVGGLEDMKDKATGELPAGSKEREAGYCSLTVAPRSCSLRRSETASLPFSSSICSLFAATTPGLDSLSTGAAAGAGDSGSVPTQQGLTRRGAKALADGQGKGEAKLAKAKEGGKVPGAAGAARARKRAEAAEGSSAAVAAPAHGAAAYSAAWSSEAEEEEEGAIDHSRARARAREHGGATGAAAAAAAATAKNRSEPREHAGRCTKNGFRAHGGATSAPNCTFLGSRHWRPPASAQVPSLIVGACAKDVRAPLEAHSIAWLEGLGRLFARDAFGVFVYWDDNGDADGTRGVLRAWAQRNRQVHVVLAPPLRAPEYYRTQRLALCRNVLLGEAVARLPAHGTMAFYDLDCKVASYEPLLTAARLLAESPRPVWDVLTANSPGPYYDQWALRSSLLGLDYDCQFDHRVKTRASCKDVAIQIDPAASPFGVRSAFNGLAVYRVGALQARNASGCRFLGSRMSRNCEHVPFTTCLRDAGLRVGVLPSMVADCGVPPLRGPFDRAKVRTQVFANGSVHQLESRHRMPLHQAAASTAKDAPKPPPWERWETASVDST